MLLRVEGEASTNRLSSIADLPSDSRFVRVKLGRIRPGILMAKAGRIFRSGGLCGSGPPLDGGHETAGSSLPGHSQGFTQPQRFQYVVGHRQHLSNR